MSHAVLCPADMFSHDELIRYAQSAESAGFDTIWLPVDSVSVRLHRGLRWRSQVRRYHRRMHLLSSPLRPVHKDLGDEVGSEVDANRFLHAVK